MAVIRMTFQQDCSVGSHHAAGAAAVGSLSVRAILALRYYQERLTNRGKRLLPRSQWQLQSRGLLSHSSQRCARSAVLGTRTPGFCCYGSNGTHAGCGDSHPAAAAAHCVWSTPGFEQVVFCCCLLRHHVWNQDCRIMLAMTMPQIYSFRSINAQQMRLCD